MTNRAKVSWLAKWLSWVAVAVLIATCLPAPGAGALGRQAPAPRDPSLDAAALTHKTYLPMVRNRLPQPIFGVQTYWPLTKPNGLDAITQMQVRVVRTAFGWSEVEPASTSPATYNWSVWDARAAEGAAARVRILATLGGNPTWASAYNNGPLYAGKAASLANMLAVAAERYDGDGYQDAPGSPIIDDWEFYNEPDGVDPILDTAGVGVWGDHGAAYADLLRQIRPGMKAANPRVRILNGGLAYDRFREDNPAFAFRKAFLTDFLAAGGGKYIDVFNFHYYASSAWAALGSGLVGKANHLRSVLAQYGVSVPMVCTETGERSDGRNGADQEYQSRYVVKTFAWTHAAGLEYSIWWLVRDLLGPDTFPYPYGLLGTDWRFKPSATAFQITRQQLGNAYFLRNMTAAELGTPQGEGYVFQDGAQMVYVAWMNDAATRSVAVPGRAARVIGKYGEAGPALNSQRVQGVDRITAPVGPSPVFIRVTP